MDMESPSGNPAAGKRPRGRPPKKEYAPALLMQELIDAAAEVYRATQELKATARNSPCRPTKVKKLLITGKALHYPETEQIQSLLAEGKPMGEVQKILRLRYSSIQTYLPMPGLPTKWPTSAKTANGSGATGSERPRWSG